MESQRSPSGQKYATPLWVISVFITFTEVVLGAAVTQTEGFVQLALTMFVLIFPTFISAAFFFILWNRPHHLFSPNEYGDKVSINEYVDAIKKDISFDESKLYEEIKQTITSTLKSADIEDRFIENISSGADVSVKDKASQVINYAIEKTIESVKESNFISIDTTPLLPATGYEFSEPYSKFRSIGDFLDYIWMHLQNEVRPYKYEDVWILKDAESGVLYRNMKRKNVNGQRMTDDRSLKDVGILPGMRLLVVKYEG